MRHRASSRSSPGTSTRCGNRCWARRSPTASSQLARARPAGLDHRPAPHRRRRAVRRRPRHGDAGRRVGTGAGRGRARRSRRPWSCRRPPGGRSPSPRPTELAARDASGVRLRPVRGHRPAGDRPTRPPGCRCWSCPSATTCWPAARSAALVMIEAIARLLPGVLGNPDSAGEDSFSGELPDLLEAPSYTRPAGVPGLAGARRADQRRSRRRRRATGGPSRCAGPTANRPDLRRTLARRPTGLGSRSCCVWHNGAGCRSAGRPAS